MRAVCERCGIAHDNCQDAWITHKAMADVRAWFRTQVLPRPIVVPSKRPANAQPVGGLLETK